MEQFLFSWKHHNVCGFRMSWRYCTPEITVKHRRWSSEGTCKGWFSIYTEDTERNLVDQKAGSLYSGNLGEVNAFPSEYAYSSLDVANKKKYGELWQNHNIYNQLSRVGILCSNLVHLPEHKPAKRGFHRSSLDLDTNMEKLTSQMNLIADNGIHDTVTIEEPMPHPVAVKITIDILSHEGWEAALPQMNVDLTPHLVCEVIKRLVNVNVAYSFFKWAEKQKDFRHTGRTYKAMLQKFMSPTNFKTRSLETFQLLVNELLENGCGPGPVNAHTYLIDRYCKVGKLDEALQHFRAMTAHGCAPNVVTYSSLINGLIRVGKLEDALKMLEEMEVTKCDPNVVTYSILIHGLVKAQRLEEACKMFEKMKKQGCIPNLITYNCLIDGVARAGKYEEVSKLLDQMRKARCPPNLFIYGTVINYFTRIGKLQAAWDLFGEMEEHGLEPNLFIYTPLMASLGKAGYWKLAQQLLKEMESKGCTPDVIAYSALIAGLMKAGKWEEGCLVMDKMESAGLEANSVIYTVLIDGLVKARQAEKAQALFTKMVVKGIASSVYTQESLTKVIEKIGAQ